MFWLEEEMLPVRGVRVVVGWSGSSRSSRVAGGDNRISL